MKSRGLSSNKAATLPEGMRPARRLAIISSFLITVLGLAYFIGLVFFAAGGKMTFPPPDGVQLFGGITSAVAVLLMPVLFVSLHCLVPAKAKVYSLLAVVFCTLFSVFVGINRFVQLSVVRVSLQAGDAGDLRRFLPYDGRSVLFALEMTGWGIMLGFAAFFLAMALGRKKLQGAARITFFVYAALALASGVFFLLNSPLSVIGFAAWGFVLYIGAGLLFFSLINYDKYWGGALQ